MFIVHYRPIYFRVLDKYVYGYKKFTTIEKYPIVWCEWKKPYKYVRIQTARTIHFPSFCVFIITYSRYRFSLLSRVIPYSFVIVHDCWMRQRTDADQSLELLYTKDKIEVWCCNMWWKEAKLNQRIWKKKYWNEYLQTSFCFCFNPSYARI